MGNISLNPVSTIAPGDALDVGEAQNCDRGKTLATAHEYLNFNRKEDTTQIVSPFFWFVGGTSHVPSNGEPKCRTVY